MHPRSISLLSLACLAACGGAPSPAEEPSPETPKQEPSVSAPASPEWELVTKGSEPGEAAACVVVRAALVAEKACVGSLCSHGAALASEWSRRCAKRATPEDAALAADLAERAKTPPTACGERVTEILAGKCGRSDATCEITSSKWAAKCAKTDGSPLVIRLLERGIATKASLPEFKLDVRSCDAIFADMRRGLVCDRASCPAALKSVRAYRSRCGGDGELPPAAKALVEVAIAAAAGEMPVPTLVHKNPAKLTIDDFPVPLADHWGALVAICGERPADLGRYVAARRACEKGKVVVVRIFESVQKDIDVRAATFDVPDDATFARRFPSLRAAGEPDARDAAAKQALGAELQAALKQAKDPADAARVIARLAGEHAASIVRSSVVRDALATADAELVPAFAEIGRAKLAAAKGAGAADLAGLAARAPTRPFADLGEDGAVSPGAPSAASRLDVTAFLPKATAAYSAALGNLAALAKRKPLPPAAAGKLKSDAIDAAKACVAAEKRAKGTERELVACHFAVNPCEPGKMESLTHALDGDRAAAVAARNTIDLATSVLPAAPRADVEKVAASCPVP